MKNIILLVIFGLISSLSFSQSQVVKDFEEKTNGYKFFAYQSVLRMLNQDKNPDFNKMIRDLDHIRVATTDSTGVLAMAAFNRLDKAIQDEGFEEILTFDNKDYKCHIYELSNKSDKSTWVATFFMEGRAGVFEMVGALDVKYLSAFSSLNMERLQEWAPDLTKGEGWD